MSDGSTAAATAGAAPEEPFSEQLERWLRSDDPKTLGAMNDVFAEKTFAVTVLLLMFIPALPLPTGGVSHVFEAITVVVAAEMVLGLREIWLPARWRRRKLGASLTEKGLPFVIRRIRQVERHSRPRAVWLFRRRLSMRLLGLVLVVFAVAATLAPPFSGLDTLPSLGAVLVALSIILTDVVILVAGVVVGAGGIVLILTIGTLLVDFARGLV